jgi:cell division cycle 14
LLHCLTGLERAIKLGWFEFTSFNLRNYEYYSKVENGDMNWIIPGKILAFSSPSDKTHDEQGVQFAQNLEQIDKSQNLCIDI